MDIEKKVDVRDERFSNVESRIEKMQDRANEFSQTRSNFQLECYIAGDEYTPITKFRHVAHNSYVAMQEVRRMLIDREKQERKLERLHKAIKHQVLVSKVDAINESCTLSDPHLVNPHFKDYDLEIFEISRQLEDVELRIKGLSAEVDYMERICDTLEAAEIKQTGTGFTNEKYQEREPEYWHLRLASQMHRSQIGAQTGVGEGNYMSALMAAEKPILEDSKNQIPKISMDVNELAVTALLPRDGVREQYLMMSEEGKKDEEVQIIQEES